MPGISQASEKGKSVFRNLPDEIPRWATTYGRRREVDLAETESIVATLVSLADNFAFKDFHNLLEHIRDATQSVNLRKPPIATSILDGLRFPQINVQALRQWQGSSDRWNNSPPQLGISSANLCGVGRS